MKKQFNKPRLKLDRQVIRYLRKISEDELLQIAGGSVSGDPGCSFIPGHCDPF